MAIYIEDGQAYDITVCVRDPATVYVIPLILFDDPVQPKYIQDRTKSIEVWHDHRFDGSGCRNWVITLPNTSIKLDLEFVRSA